MTKTTWLLVPLALTTASCLIELSPSVADPATTPVPFVRPDAAAAARAGDASPQNASASNAGADASAPSAIDAAIPDAGASSANDANAPSSTIDASPAPDAAPR